MCRKMSNNCKMNADGNGCIRKVCSEYTGPYYIDINVTSCRRYATHCIENGNFDGCNELTPDCPGLPEENCYTSAGYTCKFDTTCK